MYRKYRNPNFGRNNFRFRKRKNTGENIPVSKFINKACVNTTEELVYKPNNSFSDFEVDNRIKQNLIKKGYKDLTPIQDQSIPHILSGKDLIGIASTGTGKTLAFLIPLLNKILNNQSEKVLIIAPTREIASQIDGEIFKLTYQIQIRKALCIGGSSMYTQFRQLKDRPNLVIGTPGRIKDLADRHALDLSKFNNIVLDEVDRLLDMGFRKDLEEIMSQLSNQRQSLFFSATLDKKVTELINEYSNNPVTVRIESRETAETVEQDIVRITKNSDKLTVLTTLLSDKQFKKTLIFGRTKYGVQRLAQALKTKGHRADSIHGNKTQSQRNRSLKSFKEGEVNILVATDVAARGLDIVGVTHVINYELPPTYEDYIHRIGRTGRANQAGKALTFIESV